MQVSVAVSSGGRVTWGRKAVHPELFWDWQAAETKIRSQAFCLRFFLCRFKVPGTKAKVPGRKKKKQLYEFNELASYELETEKARTEKRRCQGLRGSIWKALSTT